MVGVWVETFSLRAGKNGLNHGGRFLKRNMGEYTPRIEVRLTKMVVWHLFHDFIPDLEETRLVRQMYLLKLLSGAVNRKGKLYKDLPACQVKKESSHIFPDA